MQQFFIIGNPRSGTTLLRLMLDAHPNITVPPECGFIIWFYQKYCNWIPDANLDHKYNLFIEDLKTAKKIENWHLDYDALASFLNESKPDNYSELCDAIYQYYATMHTSSITIWGDKNNFYLRHIKELVQLFPNAKFIHIIRDGRDVACSYKELNRKELSSPNAPKLADDIIQIANEWQQNNFKILNGFASHVKETNFISVRYEDLVKESDNELKRLCTFLHIDYHPSMLAYHKNSTTYEPEEFLQWKADTKKAPQLNKINRYKKDLSESEIQAFSSEAHTMLKRFMYEQ